MSIGQHGGPQVGVLGLGPVLICEDPAKSASAWRLDQSATLPCVTDQEVKLTLINFQSSVQFFSVSLTALRKFTNDAAALIAVLRKPDLSLFLKGDYGLSYS